MIRLDSKDDTLDEEEVPRQQILQTGPPTEPSCQMMKSDRTHSQVMSEPITSQNKVPPQGQHQTTRFDQQFSVMKSNNI